MAEKDRIKRKATRHRRTHMNRLAVRFTVFSLLIVLLAIGLAAAVIHENRGVMPYQTGVVFR